MSVSPTNAAIAVLREGGVAAKEIDRSGTEFDPIGRDDRPRLAREYGVVHDTSTKVCVYLIPPGRDGLRADSQCHDCPTAGLDATRTDRINMCKNRSYRYQIRQLT